MTGADALSYLQGQISQDIRPLIDGESMYTFVLQPTGKIDSFARIQRVAADEFVLDTDAGFGLALAARLNRFKIRVKVDIQPLEWRAIAVRGATVDGALAAWGGKDAVDLLGEHVAAPTGIRAGTAEELLVARIEAGWPAMGSEITDATIPAETGVVAAAVNFTKGCYPGQELVERMDSRGSTAPRFVRRLRGEGEVAVGDEITHDAKIVGSMTSVASTDGGWVGLAVVARSTQPGDMVVVVTAGGVVDSMIEDTSIR